jgi:hypothetical protein
MPTKLAVQFAPNSRLKRDSIMLDWLCRVFGFTEVKRFDRGDDNLTSRLRGPDGGVVMISGSDDEFKEWIANERRTLKKRPVGLGRC